MHPFGVFLIGTNNNLGKHRMRFDIPQSWIIHIAKGSLGEPLTFSQFLADATLDILGQIIGVILGLTKRHLQHEEPLRSWFKPKCRKAQRHNLASVYGVDDTATINRIARQSVRHSMLDFLRSHASGRGSWHPALRSCI